MHRALVSLAAIAMAYTPQVALADDTVGVVEAVDYDLGMVFLADGQHFIAEDELHIEELPVGQAVRIAFEASGEDRFATSFEVVRAEGLTVETSARR